jgi:uncharacterized cupredoxin-like copper-binding protein
MDRWVTHSNRPVAVAALLLVGALLVAACAAPAPAAPAAASGREIVVIGHDTMRFSPETIQVRAGEAVTLTLRNEGVLLHDLATKGASRDAQITNVPGRGRKSAPFRADAPGTYQVLCPQPGHAEAGMVARIVVAASE